MRPRAAGAVVPVALPRDSLGGEYRPVATLGRSVPKANDTIADPCDVESGLLNGGKSCHVNYPRSDLSDTSASVGEPCPAGAEGCSAQRTRMCSRFCQPAPCSRVSAAWSGWLATCMEVGRQTRRRGLAPKRNARPSQLSSE